MAPEVIQQSGYDFKADIWSLGITAMEMANGEPPNASTHPMKVLFLIPKAPAPRLQGDSYSREFKEFVAACLVKDPDLRPTARELLNCRFIRSAGKVQGLQELIQRRQMWNSSVERSAHPRFYEETLRTMSTREEKDDWVFDTVKASTIVTEKHTQKRRKVSSSRASHDVPEEMLRRLTLDESAKPKPSTPSTMRKGTIKHRSSPSPALSSAKRRASGQKKPLAPDTSFGNGGSTVRQFRRISDNSPDVSPDASIAERDENRPPIADSITKEALLGRRAYSKVVDHAFQEIYAQTGNQTKREALSRAAHAWNALDMADPEGEYHLLKLIMEKLHR